MLIRNLQAGRVGSAPQGVYAASSATKRLVTSRLSSRGSSRAVSSTNHVANASSAGACAQGRTFHVGLRLSNDRSAHICSVSCTARLQDHGW